MTTEEIKAYVLQQLERSERQRPQLQRGEREVRTESTASYYDEQLALRQLWVQAEQAELMQRLCVAVELLERGR